MASLGRASAIIGLGTLASRVTGLARSVVLVAVLGSTGSKAADAFTTANMLPTNIYELLAAGVLTGIIVPQIVKAASHSDGGARFVSKLMTLGATVLVAATALVLAIAPLLIWLYVPNYTPDQLALTLALAYWCLPQLLFYGLYALLGEVLNARRVFGPYSWAPVVNNIVSIAGFGVFLALFGGPTTEVDVWDPAMIGLLGGTATVGIALQAFVLVFFWRRVGIKVRPDFRWRGMGLRHIGTLAWWTFLAVVVGQVAGIVQSRVLSQASGDGAAITVVVLAWLVFMLPHSIVAMSISTTYFTHLAEQVAEGRTDAVRHNLDESIRLLSVFAFGFMAAIAAAAVPVSRVFTTSPEGAVQMSWVLLAYIISLVPFGVLVIVRRAFFAFHDTRTPFYFTVVQCVLAAGGALVASALYGAGYLSLSFLAAGVALSQSLSTFVQLGVALRLLRRHVGPLDLGPTWRGIWRFLVASIPAFLVGWGVFLLLGGVDGWTLDDRLQGGLGAAIVGSAALVAYVAALAVLRTPELGVATRALRRFLPGRR